VFAVPSKKIVRSSEQNIKYGQLRGFPAKSM